MEVLQSLDPLGPKQGTIALADAYLRRAFSKLDVESAESLFRDLGKRCATNRARATGAVVLG